MFTHQSSPRAYDATWEAKSTWLPEINRRVVQRNSSVRFTCYHVQELPVLSQHLEPITELGTSLHDESLRMCLIWERSYSTWHVLQVQEEKSTFISGKYPPWSQTNWVRVNISFSPSRTSGQKKYLWKWYKLRAILWMDPGNGKNEQMFGLTLPLVSRGCLSGPAHQRFSHREVLLDSQSSPWSWKTDLDILWQIVV